MPSSPAIRRAGLLSYAPVLCDEAAYELEDPKGKQPHRGKEDATHAGEQRNARYAYKFQGLMVPPKHTLGVGGGLWGR